MCNFENAFLWAVLTTAIRQALSHVTFATLTEAKSVEAVVSQYLSISLVL
jgi:hypothetical protein